MTHEIFNKHGLKVRIYQDNKAKVEYAVYVDSDGYEYDYSIFLLLRCCQQFSTL